MTNEQYDALLNEGIYPNDDGHPADCEGCRDCDPEMNTGDEAVVS